MKGVDASSCRGHILVCVHERENSTMSCCHDAHAEQVYQRLREWIVENQQLASIWITRTACLGWCNIGGTTVVIYPEGIWYRAVQADDVDVIIERHLINMLVD